jgi:hypothetical protein
MVFYECVVTARNTASKSSQPTLRFSNNINITVPSSLSLSNTMHQHSSPQILLIWIIWLNPFRTKLCHPAG